jgi:hypothetical protein
LVHLVYRLQDSIGRINIWLEFIGNPHWQILDSVHTYKYNRCWRLYYMLALLGIKLCVERDFF